MTLCTEDTKQPHRHAHPPHTTLLIFLPTVFHNSGQLYCDGLFNIHELWISGETNWLPDKWKTSIIHPPDSHMHLHLHTLTSAHGALFVRARSSAALTQFDTSRTCTHTDLFTHTHTYTRRDRYVAQSQESDCLRYLTSIIYDQSAGSNLSIFQTRHPQLATCASTPLYN